MPHLLNFTNPSDSVIYLLPVGDLPEKMLSPVIQAVEKAYGYPCLVHPALPLPLNSYDPDRNQYYSTAILKRMLKHLPKNALKVLGITSVDLFIPIMKFIFGEAQFKGRGALFSVYRLRPEFYGLEPDWGTLVFRCTKEAIHELGHTFGLPHCLQPDCVMHSSSVIQDTDRKAGRLCPTCDELFRWHNKIR
jgi:archaemetzincin